MNPGSKLSRWLHAVAVTFAIAVWPSGAVAQPAGMDPEAVNVLRRMTDFLAGLQRFSVDTTSTLEVVLTSGQKLQFVSSASAIVQRPDRIKATRKGEVVDEVFYYDGKSLTAYSPASKYYATAPAPATLEATLDFARDSLDIVAPAADLLYKNAFELMTQSLTEGFVVGPAILDGVRTTHLAFRGPEVDVQIWVQDGDKPFPRRYVITSRQVTGAPQFIVTASNWSVAPKVTDATFRFSPPKDAKRIDFTRLPGTAAPTK
jgi:hypothetical protein